MLVISTTVPVNGEKYHIYALQTRVIRKISSYMSLSTAHEHQDDSGMLGSFTKDMCNVLVTNYVVEDWYCTVVSVYLSRIWSNTMTVRSNVILWFSLVVFGMVKVSSNSIFDPTTVRCDWLYIFPFSWRISVFCCPLYLNWLICPVKWKCTNPS